MEASYKMQLQGTFNGEAIDGIYSYTRVWTHVQGRLQIVAGQVSRIQSD